MPASVSDSLSLISSVAIDLLLATTVTPRARARPVMYRVASAPSCARTTVPPASRTFACISLSSAGSSRILRRRMSRARSRMASSPWSRRMASRLSPQLAAAVARLPRSVSSASASTVRSRSVPSASG